MRTVTGLKFKRTELDAIELFRKSNVTLAEMERNGIKVDTDYYAKEKKSIRKIIDKTKTEMMKHNEIIKPWKRRAGKKFKLTSHDQLGTVLFEDLGYKATSFTEKGKAKTDKASLEKIDHPFINLYKLYTKLEKTLTTIKGVEREVDQNGFLHPLFHLNFASSFRSSSSDPNFQNFQVRDEDSSRSVRKGFISRFKNGHLVENDFKTLEVLVATCYHRDPNMLKHIREGYDYHLNMAAKLFKCKTSQVTKKARYSAKNQFVFPQFYGSFFPDCARNLWDFMTIGKLDVDGTPMREWLKSQGIRKLGIADSDRFRKENYSPKPGTFEHHVMEVENHFWNVEYPVYKKWRGDWHNAYKESLEIPYLTGFVARGVYGRNQVINIPVQGAAFHCLLWTMNRVRSIIKKKRMRVLLIGQIHDCLLADCPEDEIQEYLNIVYHVVSVELPKAFEWIITPMECEAEVCPIGGTWFDKKQWIKKNNLWQLAA